MTWTAEVRSVRPLGPHLVRVELGGPGLATFRTIGTPDESVTLYFPRDGETAPPPMTLDNGVWGYHGLPDTPVGRTYTIRAVDPLVIDFARHGDGVASAWAERARPGDGLVLWRQRGWYAPPPGTDWIVLVADLTGLPAVARILDQHDATTPVTVLTDIALDGYLPVEPRVGPLETAMRAFTPPPGDGYVWYAGESGAARGARRLWRDGHGLPRDRVTAVGYWRADAASWERRYERVRAEMERLYADRVRAGDSITEAGERVEVELERRGL